MYEDILNVQITKEHILKAARKSKHVGRTADNLLYTCGKCFFKYLSDIVDLSAYFCNCTYIREYFTYKYGVDFKHITHCNEVEQRKLEMLLQKISGRVTKI
jgi:hypothetical protein